MDDGGIPRLCGVDSASKQTADANANRIPRLCGVDSFRGLGQKISEASIPRLCGVDSYYIHNCTKI